MIRVNLASPRCKTCKAPVRPGERYCNPCTDEIRLLTDEYDAKFGMYEREDQESEMLRDEIDEEGGEA